MIRRIFFRYFVVALAVSGLLGPFSALAGDAEEVEAGIAAYDTQDYHKAKSILMPLAEKGVPKAMNMIGIMLVHGLGGSKATIVGCDWFEKAAIEGYPSAQENFAHCYLAGNGRKRHFKTGISWLKKAVEQGKTSAMLDVAFAYHDIQNKENYLLWSRRAAQSGNVAAKLILWMTGRFDETPGLSGEELSCLFWDILIGEESSDFCDSQQ